MMINGDKMIEVTLVDAFKVHHVIICICVIICLGL